METLTLLGDRKDVAYDKCLKLERIVLLGLLAGLAISQVVLGSMYKDDCPVDDKIPQYLIASGSLGIVIVSTSCVKCLLIPCHCYCKYQAVIL